MKLAATSALFGAILATSLPAYAGGMAEPTMEPSVVAAETAASGSHDWVGIMMTVLVIAAAAGN